MSKSSSFENSLLLLIFNGTAITGIAQNASSPLTNLYVALHSADPGNGGSQTTNEVTTGQYSNYARQLVARTSGGWIVTNSQVKPASDISFLASSGGTGTTVTYFSVGTAASGAGVILYSGIIQPTIVVATGVQPKLTNSTTIQED